jgi:hypothetical protein
LTKVDYSGKVSGTVSLFGALVVRQNNVGLVELENPLLPGFSYGM